MSEKTFTVAGTSVKNNVLTWRFANGSAEARTMVLVKDGHKDVKLQGLPKPMTKKEAIEYLTEHGINAVDPTARGSRAPRDSIMSRPKNIQHSKPSAITIETDSTWDQAAKTLHDKSWLAFIPWANLTSDDRDEFRQAAKVSKSK